MIKNYKSKILVFLLILGILYGCKRQILDPVLSANTAIPSKNLDKAKNWFAKNKPNFYSTNARINIDSVRYKEFFPAWQFAKMHTLVAGDTLIVVPVQRNFVIEYTEIGFLRRLCLYIKNDTVRSAKIIELISDKAILKANEDFIFKNVETALNGGTISNIDVAVLQYDLSYTHEEGKIFVGGTSKEDIALAMDNAKGDVIMIFTGENPWQDGHSGPTTLGGGTGTSTGGGGNNGNSSSCATCQSIIANNAYATRRCYFHGTPTAPPPPTNTPPPPVNMPPPPLTPIPTMPVPPPNTNVPFPNGGGGGGSSTSTIFTVVISNPTPTPPDPNCMKDTGGIGISDETTTPRPLCPYVDNGENTEPQVMADIDDIYDVSNSTLTSKDKTKLNELFKSLKSKSCLFGEMIAKMKQANFKIAFKLSNRMPAGINGTFDHTDELIMLNSLDNPLSLLEELVHAYQYMRDPTGYAAICDETLNPSQIGVSNIEFEAKLIMNLMISMALNNDNDIIFDNFEFAISGSLPPNVQLFDKYEKWIASITANYTRFPTSLTPAQQTKYYQFLNAFRNANVNAPIESGYFSPANMNLLPATLFNLSQNSNCKN